MVLWNCILQLLWLNLALFVLQSTRTSSRIRTDCSLFMPAPKVFGVPMPWTWMVCLIACKVCNTTGPSKYRIQDRVTFEDLLRLTFAVCFLTDSTFLTPAVLAHLLSAQTVRGRDCREKIRRCSVSLAMASLGGVFAWKGCSASAFVLYALLPVRWPSACHLL